MAGPLVVGTVVGALTVTLLPGKVLLGVVGLAVLGLAVQLLRTGQPTLTRTGRSIPLTVSCLLAGLSGGLVGMSGPFIVAGTARFDKGEMRRLLVAVFLIEGVVKVVLYTVTGTITVQSLQLTAVGGPAILAGLTVGIWLHRRVSQALFIKVIGWLLVIIAIQPIASALT